MSRSMTMQELGDIIKLTKKEHCPFTANRCKKIVKYIDPVIDNRDGTCFVIKFRGYGWEETLYTQNDQINNPKSLYERCIDFLNQE